jgi:hypothetical protein
VSTVSSVRAFLLFPWISLRLTCPLDEFTV